MTEELRDALRGAATRAEPAVGDAFARFTAVKRRAAIARGATVAAIGIAAAATLMFTLPGLNSGDPGGGLTGGDTTAPPQVRAVKHYIDPEGRFELDYPASWNAEPLFYDSGSPSEPEGAVFDADGYPASPSAPRKERVKSAGCERPCEVWNRYPKGFSVYVDYQSEEDPPCPTDACSGLRVNAVNGFEVDRLLGASVTYSDSTIDGLSMRQVDVSYPRHALVSPEAVDAERERFDWGETGPSAFFEWCPSCRMRRFLSREARSGRYYAILVRAEDEATFQRHARDLAVILSSLDLR